MICNLIKIIKNKIKPKSTGIKITFIVPHHISNIEADDRVEFVDHCIAKGKWGVLEKNKIYDYTNKHNAKTILEQNVYMKARYFIEYKITGECENIRGEILRVITENIKSLSLSSINNSNNFDLMFVIEYYDKSNWIAIELVKEMEQWYIHGMSTRG